jgi:hypothetical protein
MRFPLPVFEGDHVIARGRVTAIRDQNGHRYADCDIWLHREGTPPPLEGTACVELAGDRSDYHVGEVEADELRDSEPGTEQDDRRVAGLGFGVIGREPAPATPVRQLAPASHRR